MNDTLPFWFDMGLGGDYLYITIYAFFYLGTMTTTKQESVIYNYLLQHLDCILYVYDTTLNTEQNYLYITI